MVAARVTGAVHATAVAGTQLTSQKVHHTLPGQPLVFEMAESVSFIAIDVVLDAATQATQALHQPVGLRPRHTAVVGPLMDLQGNLDAVGVVER